MPVMRFNVSTANSINALAPAFDSDSSSAQPAKGRGDFFDAQSAIDAYKTGIDVLFSAIDLQDIKTRYALQMFKDFLENGPDDVVLAGEHEFFEADVVQDFKQFCALVQESKLPKDTIQKAIVNLSNGLDARTQDVSMNITSAAREMHALARGIPDNFNKHLTTYIKNEISAFMMRAGVDVRYSENTDYFNALFNSVAHEYGLESYPVEKKYSSLEGFKAYFKERFEVENVMRSMASECLLRVHDFVGQKSWGFLNSERLQEFQYKLKNQLQPELEFNFGNIEEEDLMQRCVAQKDAFILTNHIELLLPCIERNVKAAGIYARMPKNLESLAGAQAATSVKVDAEQLFSALQNNDLRRIAGLIGKISKEHLKVKDEAGNTLAMAAMQSAHVPICRHIISKMDVEDIKMENNSGKTLFSMVVDGLRDPARSADFREHMRDMAGYLVNFQENVPPEVKNLLEK